MSLSRKRRQVGVVHVIHVVERRWIDSAATAASRVSLSWPMWARTRKAVCFGGRENLLGFFGAERSAIAEDVDELGKLALRHRRNHLVADQVDIFL